MSPGPIELTLPESVSSVPLSPSQRCNGDSRFTNLRGVQWRINLGILPSCSSIEELRRVSADCRRRYAGLRRRLLVDPPKDGNGSPDLVMDNPLSLNPDSMWGQFFRNAELEKMVDQDLSRLYPEHGSYFQTASCQGILRRILLLWCLRHPEYGYRQGMHELLAPLLYVLHVDVQRLSEVRKLYEDHFIDKYDDLYFEESDSTCNDKFTKTLDSSKCNFGTHDESKSQGNETNFRSLNNCNSEIQTIVLLSDPYGAEGELGILMSEKFMEHDVFSMFDALMRGGRGVVAMADYFSPAPIGSSSGLPPVIEASAALYHLLAFVDSSLYSHLIELGVEPQYFALRWLRVLFGREFQLEDLLTIWDEIFKSDNGKSIEGGEDDPDFSSEVLRSPRGAFISAMAISMLLHLRSSLLATETATSCLQRLLNFPENIDVKKLIEKAKSIQVLALDASISSSSFFPSGTFERSKSNVVRRHSLSCDSVSPRTQLNIVPESYWEEKWRVLHKEEETLKGNLKKQASNGKKGSFGKFRLSLSRAESDPSPSKIKSSKKNPRLSVRRRLLEDLSRELGSEEDIEKEDTNEVLDLTEEPLFVEDKVEKKHSFYEQTERNDLEETCLTVNVGSEENSSIFSASTSSISKTNDHENDSEKSSVASNLSMDENDDEQSNMYPCQTSPCDSPLPVSYPSEIASEKLESNEDTSEKPAMGLKERNSGKFHWFWKFGRNSSEGISEKGDALEVSRSTNVGNNIPGGFNNSLEFSVSGDEQDKNIMGTLKNLGHSMIENIQVIECVFQQDKGHMGSLENLSRNILGGKGQVTAMAALKELRKISNLLSEM